MVTTHICKYEGATLGATRICASCSALELSWPQVVVTNTPRAGETPEQIAARSAPRNATPVYEPVLRDAGALRQALMTDAGLVDAKTMQPLNAPHALLPTDAAARKAVPVFTGVLRYFPDALCAVADLSRIGNEQHNPGQPLHWAREKSTDQLDAMIRHALDAGTRDTDGVRHMAKVAWRALAELQLEIERDKKPAGAAQQ